MQSFSKMSYVDDVFDYYARRRTLNPIHPHCGPFNEVSENPSTNEVDEICRQHDLAYGEYQKAGVDPYWTFVPEDQVFIDKMDQIPWYYPDKAFARAYGSFFKVKRAAAMNDFLGIEEYKAYEPLLQEPQRGSVASAFRNYRKRTRDIKRRRILTHISGNPIYPVTRTRLYWGKRRRRRRSFRKRRYAKKIY